MTKIVGAQRSLQRFYLYGREDAEEEFDPDDVPEIDELAKNILDHVGGSGADLRAMLRPPIDKLLEIDEFDGDEKEWRVVYSDELEGVDPKAARALWRAGYVDEALLDLESVVVDRMCELLDLADDEEDDDDEDEEDDDKGGYAAFADDGTEDAADAWDKDAMQEWIERALAAVKKSGWKTRKERDAEIDRASKQAAEDFQAAMESDGAKDEWMELNADDAKADGLNPEIAYTKHWRPAFVLGTAALIEARVEDAI